MPRMPRNPIPVILAFLLAFWLARNSAGPYVHLILTKIGHGLEHI
jgi:hypothetical protein